MQLDWILFISMLGIVSNFNLCEAKRFVIMPFIEVDYFQAVSICHANGMKSISIESEEKQEQIENAIKLAGYKGWSFWTSGLRVGGNDVEHYWMDLGERVSYTKWGSGAPGNPITSCIELSSVCGYDWKNVECSSKNRVICEKDE